ncbi:hypothetical protein IFM89_037123 [Coptis chinensis]|uniref:Aconitase/3-isopropylmalate dehydratase large subunit alpha/beta/alpha domain-containing protein n=1 Tax=Coptis chinensis TaxID=261450 RepID=A0A835HV88_9MAGN|nr:hypothetical protein IFM89_037123 [Coptis chinensis]
MYITISSSASSLLKTSCSRVRFSSTFSSSIFRTLPSKSPSSLLISNRSLSSYSIGFKSLQVVLSYSSSLKLNNNNHWRSPISISLQIRSTAVSPPLIHQFERKIASLGLSVRLGGIEAEAAMLGQPMSMVLPSVVGFKLSGKLKNGVTATDLVLTVTQMLRKHGVVGKFVEFYGEGMGELSLADRATIANMSPEYGATMGRVAMIEVYLRANNMFVDYSEPQLDRAYSSYLQLDLSEVELCMSGPKRPHDCVPLKDMKTDWHSCLDNKVGFKGFAVPKESQDKVTKFSFHGQSAELKHGSVVIAAITSCTNTSNPSVILGGWFGSKEGLRVKPWVKTMLAPGSGVVTKYLLQSGLQKYLSQQGFHVVGYRCTTCIENSGDLDESVVSAIAENDILAVVVLSGNQNFEGSVHPLMRANYLASPPLVVAYALAGTVDIDFEKEPIGVGKDGKSVYFRDIWPSTEEVAEVELAYFDEAFSHVIQNLIKQ